MEKTNIDATPTSSWSAGWYLFEDGKVVGPLTADEAFSRGKETKSGAQRMVSRKGFAQWYPLQDFAELHTLAGKYANQMRDESHLSSPSVKKSFKDVQPTAKSVGPETRISPTATIERAQAEVVAKAPAGLTSPTRKERKRLRQEEKKASKLLETQRRQDTVAAKEISSNRQTRPVATKEVTFQDQYLIVASRLRLGKVRNPYLSAYLFAPVTLFGYWASWLGRTNEEVTWHVTGESRTYFPLPLIFSFIPGLHLWFAWQLSRMVAQMERQNGYNTVSPLEATVLALIPPFYIHHIQGALNRHWRLHVAHSRHSAEAAAVEAERSKNSL